MCQHRTIFRRSLSMRVLQHLGHHQHYALWRHVKALRIHLTVFADNGVSRNVAALVDDRAVYATTFADDRAWQNDGVLHARMDIHNHVGNCLLYTSDAADD